MSENPALGKPARLRTSGAWLGWLLPVGFGIVAVGLFFGSRGVEMPVAPVQFVDPASLVVGPGRVAMSDPAHILVEGQPQNCNGCHQIFKSRSPAGAMPSYHQDIHLAHGLNNRCVNCHDPDDRERLTLRDGATVTFAQTPQLCAQCHGTVYRDWQRGTHGKTLGSWLTSSPAQLRLSCNECHNPHSPRFEPFMPLPGPNTLRMGPQGHGTPHDPPELESPLQRWPRDAGAAANGHPAGDGGHP